MGAPNLSAEGASNATLPELTPRPGGLEPAFEPASGSADSARHGAVSSALITQDDDGEEAETKMEILVGDVAGKVGRWTSRQNGHDDCVG